jgi:lipopolysaccharide transport system ATP-binding protein
MKPAIRLTDLGKRYRVPVGGARAEYRTLRETLTGLATAPLRRRRRAEEFWALRGVGFDVAPGEAVGIIGRNGAGKSTLLKILARITRPTTGTVEVRGRVASLLEVGTGFHPELTGRENIYLNGGVLGMKRSEIARKFDEIVAFSGVEAFLDLPVKRYSSGMQMRLAFAVAAHLEPDIVVIDEVLAVGDAEFRRKCLGKMGQVARSGWTVLFVSHNMAAVQNLCTRAVLLAGGSVRRRLPRRDRRVPQDRRRLGRAARPRHLPRAGDARGHPRGRDPQWGGPACDRHRRGRRDDRPHPLRFARPDAPAEVRRLRRHGGRGTPVLPPDAPPARGDRPPAGPGGDRVRRAGAAAGAGAI